MRKKYQIFVLFFVSGVLRFWRLGQIPAGLSLQEVNFALSASRYLGEWILDPFIVRLPSALLGTAAILLFYLLIEKLIKNKQLAFITSFILSIAPWHIQQSRVLSFGMILLVLAEIFLIKFGLSVTKNKNMYSLLFTGLSIILLCLSVVKIPEGVGQIVDQQRNILFQSYNIKGGRILSNKLIESYRDTQRKLFENLDFGNYFFKGHPRERWGVEEQKKLYLTMLPLVIFGFVKTKKGMKQLLLSFSLLAISYSVFKNSNAGITLLLLLPVSIISGFALYKLVTSRSTTKISVVLTLLIFTTFEFLTFNTSYFLGYGENLFSPRQPVYTKLTSFIKYNFKTEEKLLVNKKLEDPKQYFKFYLQDNDLNNFEFREFSLWQEENLDKIFIDLLPDDASPNEPLYTESGDWPSELNILAEFYDQRQRQTVVVYEFK